MAKQKKSTKQKILDSATELFLEKGVDRVSVRDIAAKAGVNLSLMNYYYQSKENLFEVIFENLIRDRALHLRGILESNLPIEEKIRNYIHEYIDILLGQPILVSFVLSIIHRNPEKVKGMEAMLMLYNSDIFCNHIRAEVDAGTIKCVDPEQLYVSMISLILFPFAIEELITDRNKFSPQGYMDFVLARKNHVLNMVLSYIKR